MYQHLKLQSTFKDTLYRHMVSAAIFDFHWEVQIAALKFWRAVIQSVLADQGMLDGIFPPVTFSKTTRKIVTLNEAEVQKRLATTLENLANNGCLTALVKLLDEDMDVEIIESSLSVSLELQNILQQYKIKEVASITDGNSILTDNLLEVIEVDVEDSNGNVDETEEVTIKSDNVIDSILDSSDINLLSNIYDRHMKLQAENIKQENGCQPKMRLQKYVSPMLFLKHIGEQDYKSLIEEKRRWRDGIRNLSSLLDDILGIYECSEDVNDMDCY